MAQNNSKEDIRIRGKMYHFRWKLVLSAILTLLFVLLTKVIPYVLIIKTVIYNKQDITIKAQVLIRALSWPVYHMFSENFVQSVYFIFIIFLYYLLLIIIVTSTHNFLWTNKLYRWILPSLCIPIVILWFNPNLLVAFDNNEPSKSIGTSSKGSLINGKRLPFMGSNYQYFNFMSYLKGNCFVHHKVKQTLIDTYKICEKTCPNILFIVGEGSKGKGGPYVFNHRTHQNGTSLDLLLVFKREDKQYDPLSLFNAYGYGLETDNEGIINKSIPINIYPKNTQIDFETNAKFLLALDEACRKNGIKIRIVILKVELKPLLFASASGKKLLLRNIYFANSLSDLVNRAHDDHFHVDFDI